MKCVGVEISWSNFWERNHHWHLYARGKIFPPYKNTDHYANETEYLWNLIRRNIFAYDLAFLSLVSWTKTNILKPCIGTRIISIFIKAFGRRNLCMLNVFISVSVTSMCSHSTSKLFILSIGKMAFWDICVIKNASAKCQAWYLASFIPKCNIQIIFGLCNFTRLRNTLLLISIKLN